MWRWRLGQWSQLRSSATNRATCRFLVLASEVSGDIITCVGVQRDLAVAEGGNQWHSTDYFIGLVDAQSAPTILPSVRPMVSVAKAWPLGCPPTSAVGGSVVVSQNGHRGSRDTPDSDPSRTFDVPAGRPNARRPRALHRPFRTRPPQVAALARGWSTPRSLARWMPSTPVCPHGRSKPVNF